VDIRHRCRVDPNEPLKKFKKELTGKINSGMFHAHTETKERKMPKVNTVRGFQIVDRQTGKVKQNYVRYETMNDAEHVSFYRWVADHPGLDQPERGDLCIFERGEFVGFQLGMHDVLSLARGKK
jgi:hypothetical protein